MGDEETIRGEIISYEYSVRLRKGGKRGYDGIHGDTAEGVNSRFLANTVSSRGL